MIIPVRCFTCGKVIASLWLSYLKMLEEGKDPEEALNLLDMRRMCCRRMFLTQVELIDELISVGI